MILEEFERHDHTLIIEEQRERSRPRMVVGEPITFLAAV